MKRKERRRQKKNNCACATVARQELPPQYQLTMRPYASVNLMRPCSDLGLDHAMDGRQVVDIGHSLVVLVLDQQVREIKLCLVFALADNRQIQVLGPLCLHVCPDHPELATRLCLQLWQEPLFFVLCQEGRLP